MYRFAAATAECRSAAIRAVQQIRNSKFAASSREFSHTHASWSRSEFTRRFEKGAPRGEIGEFISVNSPPPVNSPPSPGPISTFGLLVRPLLFTSLVTVGGLGAAAVVREERESSQQTWVQRVKGFTSKAARQNADKELFKIGEYAVPTSQAVIGGIIAANVLVFGLWRMSSNVSSLSRMHHNFLHYPQSGRGLPLLGATFSHMEPMHLGCNMFGLYSFGPMMAKALGPETFMATYLAAGAMSSLGGMSAKLAMGKATPSLGASGAVLFLAAVTAFLRPDAEFCLIFLPFVPIPATTLLTGMVAMDLAGLILRWRRFDHGAHLAAVAAAYVYVHWGGLACANRFQAQCVAEWRELKRLLKQE